MRARWGFPDPAQASPVTQTSAHRDAASLAATARNRQSVISRRTGTCQPRAATIYLSAAPAPTCAPVSEGHTARKSTKGSLLLELAPLRHEQDLLECLHVPHRVVDRIVVMGRPPEPLPALGLAPVPVEAGPEVADAAARVPERIVHSSPVEHASYPLPVVGGVVADKDRRAVAEVVLEPGRKTLGNFLIGR